MCIDSNDQTSRSFRYGVDLNASIIKAERVLLMDMQIMPCGRVAYVQISRNRFMELKLTAQKASIVLSFFHFATWNCTANKIGSPKIFSQMSFSAKVSTVLVFLTNFLSKTQR